ncbi:hypothetical protein LWI28_006160 [Acer negundo]|uniref:NB-ARC domain-containing protein n=1 Tax=Acer negundo TaxID=4023 RepID=A0AAD5JSR1_ACENE|nr:hypothetical protein LWI28_006160 [Acer negundo]
MASSITGSIVVEACCYLCGSIYSNISNTVRIQSNIQVLEKEMKNLISIRNDMKSQLAKAEKDGKLPTIQVKEWLRNVEYFMLEVERRIKQLHQDYSRTLAKVINLLKNDGVQRIGVWGTGGVGKTTVVKNINNRFKTDSSLPPSGMVIWATVSKKFDLKRVQLQIAERLNLQIWVFHGVKIMWVRRSFYHLEI